MRPAEVRFYFDADILGLGKLISSLRPDCTYPGDPGATVHKRARGPCIITTPATDDTIWISQVTAQGLLIVTRDTNPAARGGDRSSRHERGRHESDWDPRVL